MQLQHSPLQHLLSPHASELARLARSQAQVRPGSIEEAEALARIDDARLDDIDSAHGRTRSRSRRRMRRYWSDRGAQLDGR